MKTYYKNCAHRVVLLLAFVPVCCSFGQSYTVEQAVTSALQNNSRVQQYKEKTLQKQYEEKNAYGNFLPVVTVNSSYNHLDKQLTIDLSPIRDAMIALEARDQVSFTSIISQIKGGTAIADPSSPTYQMVYRTAYTTLDKAMPQFIDTLKKQEYPSAAITIVQPLFTGGKIIAAARVQSADRKASEYDLTKTKNEIVQETINDYITIALVKQIVRVRSDVLSGMERHQQNALKLAEQGLIAKYHLLRAQVAVSEAKRDLFDDLSRLDLAKLALCKVLNSQEDISFDIVDTLRFQNVNDSLPYFIESAEKNQPLFGIINEKKIMAKQKVNIQKSTLMPQIAAFGKYELFPDYLSALEPAWAIGVNANITLFAGLKNIITLKQAIHQVKEVELIESQTHRDIHLLLNKINRDMRSAEQRYNKLDDDLNLAQENFRQCQSRFESGYGTSLEVIDAQLVVEKNRIERLIALYDYYKSLTDLYTTAGHPEQVVSILTKGE